MSKEQIIDYIMTTPENTNRAILGEMLDSIAKGGGSDSWTVLTEESVTTTLIPEEGTVLGSLSYSQQINADTIRVTFNGAEYECEKRVTSTPSGDNYTYGAENNWGDYPFTIHSNAGVGGTIFNAIDTETAGTYIIKIEVPQSGGGSSDFSTAEVTITNTAEEQTMSVPMINNAVPTNEDVLVGGRTLFASESVEVVVVLYQGTALFKADRRGTISVTGDIETLSAPMPMCLIHGNGTITISSGSDGDGGGGR